MGYDLELIQVPTPKGTTFPVKAETAATLLAGVLPLAGTEQVTQVLLGIEGMREGPGGSIDYLGKGMSYARFRVGGKGIHVENNCSAKDLVRIYTRLVERYPSLLIHDLQSRQLHNADSFLAWWAKPL